MIGGYVWSIPQLLLPLFRILQKNNSPMKRSLLLILLLGLALISSAQGITFAKGSWSQVLAEAQKERKLIFVDAYAEWCGPCKAMARNTFPIPTVGAFFNEHFVSYQFDMEKGEGPEFARKYGITAYPTLLFINYKGEVVHKAMGYMAGDQLIQEARKSLDPSKNAANLELEVASGEAEPGDVLRHAMNLRKEGKEYTSVIAQYFSTQADKDLYSAQNWEAIRTFTSDPASREFMYLLEKQKAFIKAYGEVPVTTKIQEVLKNRVLLAALGNKPEEYHQALRLATQYMDDEGQMANRLKMTYAEATRNWDDYALKALLHFRTYTITDARELDHAASLFAEHISDTERLEAALNWIRQSVALENAAYNNATFARLLHKLGRKPDALRQAYVARRITELEGKDTAEIDRLIAEIQ
ncbi:MAG: thioredoxin [Bacteroidetes bacterium]|nr:MAG: thioredoxin [Bacteroidota bacterium]